MRRASVSPGHLKPVPSQKAGTPHNLIAAVFPRMIEKEMEE
jgi:hypothetical protein